MKNFFLLRAPTVDGKWQSFYISDCPCMISEKHFCLLGKPGSAIMYRDVYRGDDEYNLFDGDVIFMEGREWLICYERGFYAINTSNEKKFLYELKDYKYVGVQGFDTEIAVATTHKKNHLFCAPKIVFSLWGLSDIQDGMLYTPMGSKPIAICDVHQECCASYNGVKMYLGLTYGSHIAEMHGGRLTYREGDKYIDFITGGELIGYTPKSDG